MLTVILRDTDVDIEDAQIVTLLKMIMPDLEATENQATTFSLIRAILSRKLVKLEVYDLMDSVSRILVTNQCSNVRELCRQAYVQFIIYYPHGHQRFSNQIAYLLNQLDYEHETGRESVLDLINLMLTKLSNELFTEYSDFIFVKLVMTLANDKSSRCREMSSMLIKTLVLRLDIGRINTQLLLLEKWYSSGASDLKKISIQLFGLFADAFGHKANKWSSYWLKNIKNALLEVLTEWNEVKETLDTQDDSAITLSLWETGYFSLLTLSKMLKKSPVLHAHSDIDWQLVIELLLYPHQWVRKMASDILGSLFSNIDHNSKKMVGSVFEKSQNNNTVAIISTEANCRKVAKILCDQLDSDVLTSEHAKQIVKNLFFLSNLLISDMRKEHDIKQIEEEQDEGAAQGSGLLSLIKRLSFLARADGSKRKRGIILRSSVFHLFAAVFPKIPASHSSSFLQHILLALLRCVQDETFKGHESGNIFLNFRATEKASYRSNGFNSENVWY